MRPRLEFELLDQISLGENIWVFAITGGPCSGKTSGLAYLEEKLTARGYKVLIVPESATKLISGGILPWEMATSQFQRGILVDTLAVEQVFFEAARYYRNHGKKVIVLCDRGTKDGEAYMGKDPYARLLKSFDYSENELCDQRYHAVFHLRTAAIGAEKFFTLENNKARKETLEEARALDERTLEAWQRHPHPRVIDNSTDFAGKMHRLFAEISAVLGDPVPLEIEDKFLILKIRPEDIIVPFHTAHIIQNYLVSPQKGDEYRVRARSDGEGTTYFYTVKTEIEPGVRAEKERLVDSREYHSLLSLRDPECVEIRKKRISFFWRDQYYEVDLFESPDPTLTLMEAERTDRNSSLQTPPFIPVIRNVTGSKEYSNKEIARKK